MFVEPHEQRAVSGLIKWLNKPKKQNPVRLLKRLSDAAYLVSVKGVPDKLLALLFLETPKLGEKQAGETLGRIEEFMGGISIANSFGGISYDEDFRYVVVLVIEKYE